MLPENTFSGQVAIVTGGGTGIGFAIASQFAKLGGNVVIASRSAAHLAPAVEKIRSETGRADAAEFFELDVRNPEQVEEVVAKTVERYGRVTKLVNNAAGNFIAQASELSPN